MKILITDPISSSGINLLEESGFELIYDTNLKKNDILKLLENIDAWIVRSGTKVTKELIYKSKNLKIIGRAGVGVDNIDIIASTEKGVVVMNTPDGNTISAAEHTIAMISTLSRNIHSSYIDLIQGNWNRHSFLGVELMGKTLGIIGLGRIGLEVAHRAFSFGMKVFGYDPYVNENILKEKNIVAIDLDQLSRESDFITLHVPLVESTKYLFDYNRFRMMKKTSRIINVARGGLINETDLAKALNDNIISGAAIDVFENEPIEKNSPLLNTKNILLTPHLGASTLEAKEGVSISICKQVINYLKYEEMGNAINIPLTDMGVLTRVSEYINLAETIGSIQRQLLSGAIKSIYVDCYGTIEESKIILLSFIKGLLSDIVDGGVNFINANIIAKQRGIKTSHSCKNKEISFSNLIMTKVETDTETVTLGGCVFGKNLFRIVDIMGFELDFKPEGNMLFIQNRDVPGVIGKVGSILGENKINIGEYLLSRTSKNDIAYAVVKLDCKLDSYIIDSLKNLDEIVKIQQLKL